VSYRAGDTPDLSAVPFTTTTGVSSVIAASGRYFQFMLTETATNPAKAASVKDVTLTFKLQ
jgi:hypothetical protein